MNIKINGDKVELSQSVSITELLKEQKVKMPEMVTVEYNGDILDRAQFASTQVRDGDAIELLYYMGGGGASQLRR